MIFLTSSTFIAFPKVQWLWLGLLVLGAQLLGHTMFNLSLKRLSPVVVSLVVFFEVPVAAVFALLWLHQQPSAGIIPGDFRCRSGPHHSEQCRNRERKTACKDHSDGFDSIRGYNSH